MSGIASVVLIVHIFIAMALIGVVLLQRSEGGALGVGGGSGSFMSARGAGNALTRATMILAAMFFSTSLALTVLSRNSTHELNLQNPATAKGGSPQPVGAPTGPVSAPTSAPTSSPAGPVSAPVSGPLSAPNANGPPAPSTPAPTPAPVAPPKP